MEVRNIPKQGTEQVSVVKEPTLGPSDRNRLSKEAAPSDQTDRLELSEKYVTMSKIGKVAMELGDMRSERVDAIRKTIEDGSYVVDPDRLAAKMLEELS